jgi:hypothetical protein
LPASGASFDRAESAGAALALARAAASASAFFSALGRRIMYSGTATNANATTRATTICARTGRSDPPLPTPRRRSEGSPEAE